MHALLAKVAGVLLAPSLFMWGLGGYHVPTIVELQNLADQQTQNARSFGAFNPTGGTTYKLSNSVGLSNSSVYLTSFKEPVSNIPYTMTYLGSSIEYGTIAPQSTVSEFISFTGITQNTDGTAVLTGVSRGLSRTPAGNGCTASTTLAQTHPAQTNFILSDSPCLFGEYYVLRNSATSTNVLTFTSTQMPRYDTDPGSVNFAAANPNVLVNYAQLARTSLGGVVNASETQNGVVELATQVEMSSSTATGSTGAALDLQAKYATSSPFTPGRYVPITGVTGTLSAMFISTSSAYTWSGLNTFTSLMSTGSTTVAANASNKLTLNGLSYVFPTTRGASSSALSENGSGTLSWQATPVTMLYNASVNLSSTATATTTLATVVIPANTWATNKSLRISIIGQGSGTCYMDVEYGNGASTSTLAFSSPSNGSFGNMTAITTLNSMTYSTSTNTQFTIGTGGSGTASQVSGAYTSVTASSVSYIGLAVRDVNSVACTIVGATVELLSS